MMFGWPMNRASDFGGRPIVDLQGVVSLLGDPPVIHDDDAVGKAKRFGLVVGDKDRRRPRDAADLLDLAPHVVTQPRVEVAERLVQQEHPRLDHQRATQGDPLLLTPAQSPGKRYPYPTSRTSSRAGLAHDARFRSAGMLRMRSPKANVVEDRHVRNSA